jgi:hypothetical protein
VHVKGRIAVVVVALFFLIGIFAKDLGLPHFVRVASAVVIMVAAAGFIVIESNRVGSKGGR